MICANDCYPAAIRRVPSHRHLPVILYSGEETDQFGHRKLGGVGDRVSQRLREVSPKFNEGTPGICMDTARWVAEEVQAGVTGGDTWNATDPVPDPNEETCAFCTHQYLQTRHGIVNQENLRLTQLVDDGTFVFAYIYGPVPIRGATGSIGSPIAIK